MLPNIYHAIDIGSHSIKIAKIKRTGAIVTLETALHIPLPVTPEVSAIWKDKAAETIRQGLLDARLNIKNAVVGISGKDAIIRYSRVPPVPSWRLDMIMKYQMDEMAGKQGHEVSSDYAVLRVPRSHQDDFLVLVAMARNELVSSRLEILEKAGISPVTACPSAVALYNSFLAAASWEEDKTILVLDIGKTNTDIALVNNGDLYFARTVSLGGDAFTASIADELRMSEKMAEKVKIEEGIIKIDRHKNVREENISNALMSVGANFSNMIASTINFAKTQTQIKNLRLDKVVLSGGGSLLKGLAEYLATTLGCDIEFLDVKNKITNTISQEEQASFSPKMLELSTALGLALTQTRQPYMNLDLIHGEFRKKRDFKEKTRFSYIAGVLAIVLLITLFSLGFYASSISNSIKNELEKARETLINRESANRENVQEIRRLENIIATLSNQAEQGYFFTNLLLELRNIIPVQMTISGITIEWQPTSATASRFDDAPRRMVVAISGKIMDPSRREYAMLEEFAKRLSQHPRIKNARETMIRDNPAKGVEFIYHIFPEKEILSAADMGR